MARIGSCNWCSFVFKNLYALSPPLHERTPTRTALRTRFTARGSADKIHSVVSEAQHAAAAPTARAHRTASQAPWRRPTANTCRISAAIADTCTATTAGSVHTATVRYQDKPPHTHRRGEGSAQHRAREHGALSHLDDGRAGGLGIDCCSGTTRRAARWRHATERSGGGPGSQRGPRSICFATPSPLAPAPTGRGE
jgi:hypothetical protein